MGRKTAASGRKLRKEQKAAEQEASINALQKAKSVYDGRGDVNSCGDWKPLGGTVKLEPTIISGHDVLD